MCIMDVSQINSANERNRAFIISNYALNKSDSFTPESLVAELLQEYKISSTSAEVKARLQALVGLGLLVRRYPNAYIVRKAPLRK